MSQLAFLIPLFPLLAFALIIFFLNKNNRVSALTAVAGIGLALVVAYGVFFETLGRGAGAAQNPAHFAFNWIPTGLTSLTMGWMIDPLAAVMLFMVTTVCLMIFIYSIGYMREPHRDAQGHVHWKDDPRYARFFAYISLFATGMLGMVISANMLALFISWEIMGLCSYLLIGFWFEKNYADPKQITPRQAGLKAFLTTRIGDVALMTGLIFLYIQTGDLDFKSIFTAETLNHLAATFAAPGLSWATLIGLLILAGTIGKSAQFPLHVWLPDAMEGPTPVSALIHAATMVAAGVFLIARTFPIFIAGAAAGGGAMIAVAAIGAFTALFAATIGLAQNDIKRVLAYSTISQLGYMVAALGVGAYVAAAFHLIMHAFFKALLFLGSGSVIHSVETNDMMQMGGLRKKMPITFLTFLIGALALSGIPPFAGFWSKDEILADAFERAGGLEKIIAGQINWLPFVVWIVLLLAAFFTAFYMTRQVFLTFFGEARQHNHAHESPAVMWVPLAILAVFATFLGFWGVPFIGNAFYNFVGAGGVLGIEEKFEPGQFSPIVAGISVVFAFSGIVLGWLLYGLRPLRAGQKDPLERLGVIWTVLKNKYFVDEIYRATFVALSLGFMNLFWLIDRWIVDGLVNLAGRVAAFFAWLDYLFDKYVVDGIINRTAEILGKSADVLRLMQTGRVQNYLLIAITGAAFFALIFILKPT